MVVPVVFAAVMIGLFAMQYFSATSALSTVLWAATITAVIARLGMSDRENKSLLEQVRTDSLTGLGSRGRHPGRPGGEVRRGDGGDPVALVLLDLNGFKHYNDSFGHPAGDALLTRLGASLRAAVGSAGTAYRFGGDEFCLLLTCPPEQFDEVARAGGRFAQRRAGRATTSTRPGARSNPARGARPRPRRSSSPTPACTPTRSSRRASILGQGPGPHRLQPSPAPTA